jgi:hypothetical protein
MEDLNIDKDKLHALEVLGELEDLYIGKISQNDNDSTRQRLEPLRKCINYLRDEYQLDDKAEYLYGQYVKGIRYGIIYSDIIEQLKNESTNDETNNTADGPSLSGD